MRHHSWSIPVRLWISLILFVGLVAACGPTVPTGKYEALAKSSQALLHGTQEAYSKIEQMQDRYLVSRASIKDEIDRKAFEPIATTGQSFDIVPELEFREAALEVLARYAEVLYDLAIEDFGEEVDQASRSLAGSLNALGSTVGGKDDLVKGASGVLGTLADTTGRIIVDKKRLDALKEVMDQAQPALESLSDRVVVSNKKIQQAVDLYFQGIFDTRARLYQQAEGYDRLLIASQTARELKEYQATTQALTSLVDGVKMIPVAHKEIREDLGKKAKAKEALKRLVQEAKRINKFYRSVK